MNCFQSGGFADRQGVFLSTSAPLKIFLTDILIRVRPSIGPRLDLVSSCERILHAIPGLPTASSRPRLPLRHCSQNPDWIEHSSSTAVWMTVLFNSRKSPKKHWFRHPSKQIPSEQIPSDRTAGPLTVADSNRFRSCRTCAQGFRLPRSKSPAQMVSVLTPCRCFFSVSCPLTQRKSSLNFHCSLDAECWKRVDWLSRVFEGPDLSKVRIWSVSPRWRESKRCLNRRAEVLVPDAYRLWRSSFYCSKFIVWVLLLGSLVGDLFCLQCFCWCFLY
jgi:hypothetical protein